MANVINCEAVARNVRIARAKVGISQIELAEKSGVSDTSVSFIENAKHKKVRMSTLVKLAEALGMETEELLKE